MAMQSKYQTLETYLHAEVRPITCLCLSYRHPALRVLDPMSRFCADTQLKSRIGTKRVIACIVSLRNPARVEVWRTGRLLTCWGATLPLPQDWMSGQRGVAAALQLLIWLQFWAVVMVTFWPVAMLRIQVGLYVCKSTNTLWFSTSFDCICLCDEWVVKSLCLNDPQVTCFITVLLQWTIHRFLPLP